MSCSDFKNFKISSVNCDNLNSDTIIALITPPGVGAVSIVRISGALVQKVVSSLIDESDNILLNPRKFYLANIKDLLSHNNEFLDRGLVVFFKAPHSYTGEDIVEFNIHGNPLLVDRLIANSCALGVRLAGPGEFTQRAFLNGLLDLSQAESVLDLISAESNEQIKTAGEQLKGKLSNAIVDLSLPLRDVLSEIEAIIDFPEEEIESNISDLWINSLEQVLQKIEQYINSYSFGKISREGVKVCLSGFPNVGKSSLLNSLIGENRAIVSSVPGTTRDYLEERISINGFLVRIWDTAGLETFSDNVDRLAVDKALERIGFSDLVLYLFDMTEPLDRHFELLSQLKEISRKILFVGNKIDLLSDKEFISKQKESKEKFGDNVVFISTKERKNLEFLKLSIKKELFDNIPRTSLLITNQRHKFCLENSRQELFEAIKTLKSKIPLECISVHIRASLFYLEEIVGITTNEDILDIIFSKFCIGK